MNKKILDAHIRIGESFNTINGEMDTYLKCIDEANIGGIICPNKPLNYNIEDGNNLVIDILNKTQGEFYMGYRVDPWTFDAEMEIIEDKILQNNKIKFIYLNPWEENFQCNRPIVYPVINMARKLNLHVIVETGYPWVSHISQVVDLCRQYKDVKILATNSGQYDLSASTLDDVAFAMSRVDNLYLETAGGCGAEWLQNLKEKYPNRILFASNFPIMEPKLEVLRITDGFFTEQQKEEIMWKNLNHLIK